MIKVIELDIDPELSGDTGVFEVALVEYPAIEQELIYFSRQKFYKATEEISRVACQAIKENEKRGNPAATQVGKVRGQQLCNRDEISLETVKRMYSYLERAKVYNTDNWDDNGTISWKLWGGQPALDWSKRILDSLEKKKEEMGDEGLENACWDNYKPEGLKPAPDGSGRMVPNCVPVEAKQQFVKPEAGEDKSEFISRCIAYLVKNENKEQDQAAAMCYSMWEQDFAFEKISFDWDDTLSTERGRRLLELELSRGNIIYIISARSRVSNDMLRLARDYNIPGNRVFAVGSNPEKIKKVKDLGIKRHYDNNPNVIRELGSTGYSFDYDISALPDFVNYPESGDTNAMLIKPILTPVLFNEDCGCGQNEFAVVAGYIDGLPVFVDEQDAKDAASIIGCDGTHEHVDENGNIVYMPCAIHPEIDEYTEEEKLAYEVFMDIKKTNPEKFAEVAASLRGRTRSEIAELNHSTATPYFMYTRDKTTKGDTREFCQDLEGQFFRRMEIDLLRDTNLDFGHKKQPYSKWLYLGGPNCVHYWSRWIAQGPNIIEVGRVEGLPGTPMYTRANNGYYNSETKKASERAYAISQSYSANDGPFNVLYGDLAPIDYVEGLPIYGVELQAQDASYAIGCGGVVEKIELEGKEYFMACSKKAKKVDMHKMVFATEEEKRMIYTPLMIPNILIPRMDEVSGERYFVKFLPSTIQKIQRKFMIEQRLRETNLEHSNKKFNDIVMVESWIVEGDKDKAYELGFTKDQIPKGTWMAGYTVLETDEGNEIWEQYIKPGKVKGASVEGNFILNFSTFSKDEYLLKKIINILKQIS